MRYILGFDTSCYTTSIAGVALNGKILFNHQVPLNVPHGERGLQQSVALFHHLKNLPLATAYIRESMPRGSLAAVCASVRPRPAKDSYMPVFQFSHHIGQAVSDLFQVPFYPVSHQESHIMAGLYAVKGPHSSDFLALHLSGGTTELLFVHPTQTGLEIDLVGNSLDIPAGQFVDRIGVAMGLSFPAGPHLEELAAIGTGSVMLTGRVKGLDVSFSGPETQGQRLIKENTPYSEVAYAVYDLLSRIVSKWILRAVEMGYPKEILLVGGVSSSNIFRQGLQDRLKKRNRNIRVFFASPELSKDNAVGTALLGLQVYQLDYLEKRK